MHAGLRAFEPTDHRRQTALEADIEVDYLSEARITA
jgi:hypothetical protein